MVVLFIDTGISILKEESGDNSLKNDDYFYIKSRIQTKVSKIQKVKNNSTGKTVLKYIFYIIIAIIGIILTFIFLFIYSFSQMPSG